MLARHTGDWTLHQTATQCRRDALALTRRTPCRARPTAYRARARAPRLRTRHRAQRQRAIRPSRRPQHSKLSALLLCIVRSCVVAYSRTAARLGAIVRRRAHHGAIQAIKRGCVRLLDRNQAVLLHNRAQCHASILSPPLALFERRRRGGARSEGRHAARQRRGWCGSGSERGSGGRSGGSGCAGSGRGARRRACAVRRGASVRRASPG
jgi:hypothetical protein